MLSGGCGEHGCLISQLDGIEVPYTLIFRTAVQSHQKETLAGETAGAQSVQETGNRVTSAVYSGSTESSHLAPRKTFKVLIVIYDAVCVLDVGYLRNRC